MKSKKKKNKQNILIAYNKSIASMHGIELAMLFCHAGFSVKTILLDGAEQYISSELLKEITGHSPWSKLHKPNWVKADINYPVGIVIEPSEEILKTPSVTALHSQCSPLSQPLADSSFASKGASSARNDDIFAEYIKKHCGFVKILRSKESVLSQDSNYVKEQIITIPDNPLKLRSLFEKILSETVEYIATKALDGNISYRFEGDFSNIEYVGELEKTLVNAGIEESDNKNGIATPHRNAYTLQPFQSLRDSSPTINVGASEGLNDCNKLIISKENKEIEVVLEASPENISPTEERVYVFKHKNGLILVDNIETRLLPNFSCQSCYARLVSYLKVILSKKQ